MNKPKSLRTKEKDTPQRTARVDGTRTRARIIESAGRLIGASGLAETTSKAIAAAAGVDLASINYHFGNRDGLYKAVLVEAHRRLITLDELQGIANGDRPPQDKLRQFLDRLVTRALTPRNWNGNVLARELLSPGSHIEVLLEQEIGPKFRVMSKVLSEISGIPVGDPALIRCAVSIGAPCAMIFVAHRNDNPLSRQIDAMDKDELVDHLLNFALGGLQAIGRNHARTPAPSA
ncbi:TetR/AcrR family transcriptional regulator [Novosphingobium pentaromativorans]|uniref:TetR family transcriptional regulator n=1 Tax=Novosphingobium pentaromativorans US6-1 TaxID=1088721 RepID=G6EIW8_9SPHN|nr:TetR/AcrR family transcriptional regulator [Novosphingobium pentaromativorans]AIT78929.1 transcriptional regulator [Novosphingobium pentaromativorans US6-1]EHJ58727.1 TetR family transcriptional regulator [Novosphingobium pentaromativorans US6-1]